MVSAIEPREMKVSIETLPFDQRACFIAGQAKSGTTLMVALLDNHPELLVLPEETAYFPTVLTKYAPRGRRAQFDYITQQSLSNVLFGSRCKWGKRDYSSFPTGRFYELFEQAAFDPANAQKDLLVLMVEAYAATLGCPLENVRRWVEKTPANRNYISSIFSRFPAGKTARHAARSACDPGGANCSGKNPPEEALLGLLCSRSLASRGKTSEARPQWRTFGPGRALRTTCGRALNVDGKSM